MHSSGYDHSRPDASRARRAALALAAAGRAVARIVAECNSAQRQLLQLQLHPDRYAADGDSAPGTYAEFLFRCPEAIWHEPTASMRAGGSPGQPFGGR